MNAMRFSRMRQAAVGLAAAVVLAGCSVAAPTPQIDYVTPPPTPIIIYVTPPPTPTPAVTPTPEATSTPAPTAAPTPSPTASQTSSAAACTGTADNKAFFAKAAGAMNWTVYCAVLPSGWSITKGSYTNAPNGLLEVDYLHGSEQFLLYEGNVCGLMAGFCTWHSLVTDQGPAAFDHLAAESYLYGPYRLIDVDYGSAHEYLAGGTELTQSQFVAYAAAIRVVPRP